MGRQAWLPRRRRTRGWRLTEVASANWLASASLAAQRSGEGVFVDIGSTTTDVLVLAGGAVAHEGSTDRERLASGELVYSGLTRTPVMALAGEAPFAGRRVAVMNELFATTADVYRVLGCCRRGPTSIRPPTAAPRRRRPAPAGWRG